MASDNVRMLARYNAWANELIFKAVAELPSFDIEVEPEPPAPAVPSPNVRSAHAPTINNEIANGNIDTTSVRIPQNGQSSSSYTCRAQRPQGFTSILLHTQRPRPARARAATATSAARRSPPARTARAAQDPRAPGSPGTTRDRTGAHLRPAPARRARAAPACRAPARDDGNTGCSPAARATAELTGCRRGTTS